METVQPRLLLLTPLGQDAAGTYWHAHDQVRQHAVRVHELQGAHAHQPPTVPEGFELVTEAGRLFVIFPADAPTPAMWPIHGPAMAGPGRRSHKGVVIGGIVAAFMVLLLVGAVGATAVILANRGEDAVNVTLKDISRTSA
ncbi:hypothetical protein ACFQX7_32305 [Luedemannella flava]